MEVANVRNYQNVVLGVTVVGMAREFFWIGNHPGLDFLNTAVVDGKGEPLELLEDVDAVWEWAEQAGLVGHEPVSRALPPAAADKLLAWVRALRRRGRALLDPTAQKHDAARDLAEIVGGVPVRLTYQPNQRGGTLSVAVATTDPSDVLRLALARTVLEAADLDVSRIRRCESDRCVLLYYDTSRNRSRRWCDMATCGNRAKVAAHYRRAHHPGGRPADLGGV